MNLNRKQRRVIYAALAVLALMLLFPPWEGGSRYGRFPGYYFFLDPYHAAGHRVDWGRVLLQVLIVAVVTTGAVLKLGEKPE